MSNENLVSVINPKKVILLGGGNVAGHLIKSITSSGHHIMQIYNRTMEKIQAYSKDMDIVDHIHGVRDDADIYIVCVKDSAIEELSKSLRLKDKLIVHTSGNRSIDLLKNVSTRYGIFYPLQSFTKGIPVDFREVPILIEASTEESEGALRSFAVSISNHVLTMREEDRLKLNLAGVFVNNFTNHMYTWMYDYLREHGLDFRLLLPLIQNTVDKIKIDAPASTQTGPAVRNDEETIERQMKLLYDYPDLYQFYGIMTRSILSYYHDIA